MIDFLGQELGAVRAWVGAGDRARLDAHLESVRDIERRLAPAAPAAPVGRVRCRRVARHRRPGRGWT